MSLQLAIPRSGCSPAEPAFASPTGLIVEKLLVSRNANFQALFYVRQRIGFRDLFYVRQYAKRLELTEYYCADSLAFRNSVLSIFF